MMTMTMMMMMMMMIDEDEDDDETVTSERIRQSQASHRPLRPCHSPKNVSWSCLPSLWKSHMRVFFILAVRIERPCWQAWRPFVSASRPLKIQCPTTALLQPMPTSPWHIDSRGTDHLKKQYELVMSETAKFWHPPKSRTLSSLSKIIHIYLHLSSFIRKFNQHSKIWRIHLLGTTPWPPRPFGPLAIVSPTCFFSSWTCEHWCWSIFVQLKAEALSCCLCLHDCVFCMWWCSHLILHWTSNASDASRTER